MWTINYEKAFKATAEGIESRYLTPRIRKWVLSIICMFLMASD